MPLDGAYARAASLQPRNRKPQRWEWREAQLAANEIAPFLVALVPTWEGGGRPYDPIRKEFLSQYSGDEDWVNTAAGPAVDTTHGQAEGWFYSGAAWLPEDAVTIIIHKKKRDATDRATSGFGVVRGADSNSNRCHAHLPFSDGAVYWDFGGSSGSARLSVSSLTFGDDCWAFRAGDGGSAIFRNGVKLASHANAISRTNDASQNFFYGNAEDQGTPFTADNAVYDFLAVADVEISDRACEWVTRGHNRFALIRPDPFQVMPSFKAPAAGGATVPPEYQGFLINVGRLLR